MTFSGTSFSIVGEQQWQSCIQNTSPSSPTILASGTSDGLIYGLHLSHAAPFSTSPPSETATVGGDAIRAVGSNDNLSIENVYVEANYVGLNLDETTGGSIMDVSSIRNVSHGISIVGASILWTIGDIFVEANGGDGLYVGGSGTLGDINVLQSYLNTGHAMELRGIGGPLTAKISNCFLGEDLGYGALLDTGGGRVDISSCQLESEGVGGIFATANNAEVNLSAITADHNTGHAIELLAAQWQVSGGNIVGSSGSGIVGGAGTGLVVNVRTSGNVGCGVYVDTPVLSAQVIGVDAHDNDLCAIFASPSTTVVGTVPN